MKATDDVLWMRPKKWREFQHYQDGRTLTWIKNYIDLDDAGSKFKRMSWADQGRLQALWRLAGRLDKDGMVPFDEQYIRAVLGDKRFTLASQVVTDWFHIGTQKDLKRAGKREIRSRTLAQGSSPKTLEVRGKKPPYPPSGKGQKLALVKTCPECLTGGGAHTFDCTKRSVA